MDPQPRGWMSVGEDIGSTSTNSSSRRSSSSSSSSSSSKNNSSSGGKTRPKRSPSSPLKPLKRNLGGTLRAVGKTAPPAKPKAEVKDKAKPKTKAKPPPPAPKPSTTHLEKRGATPMGRAG